MATHIGSGSNAKSYKAAMSGQSESAATKIVGARREGAIIGWSIVGLVWVALCVVVWGRWISSSEFSPAPILGPDVMGDSTLMALRVLEVISVLVLLACAWGFLIKPWVTKHQFTIEGKMLIGGVFAFLTDCTLNVHHYLFAFNSNSINMGSWSKFMPFYTGVTSSRYGEALLWGGPMYIYFGVFLGYCGTLIIRALRRKWPDISNAVALTAVYGFILVFDVVVENAIIRSTEAYAFVKTYEPLTLFEGEWYQFPFYEALFVGFMATGFTIVGLSAMDDPNGVSVVERGYERFDQRIQPYVRLLAVIGVVCTMMYTLYHIPFNWLGVIGDSIAALPSYLRLK
jgi:Spirocyclase AveC-like